MSRDPTDIHLCFVGDSFVNGTGDPTCLGWTGRVCAAAMQRGYPLTYYNLGIRRNTSADIAARWFDECVRRFPPDGDGRIVFSCGVNDTTIEDGVQRLAGEATLGHLRAMLQAAHRRFPVLLIGPPPVADTAHNARIARLCPAMATIANDVGVPYLPVFETLAQSPIWRREVAQYDGSHPRQAGYEELAAVIQRWSAWWFVES